MVGEKIEDQNDQLKSKKQLESAIMIFAVIVVVILGLANFLMVSNYEPNDSKPLRRTIASISSISESSELIKNFDSKMAVLNLDCIQKIQSEIRLTFSKHIRLTGKICKNIKVKDGSLKNYQTGHEGEMFVIKQGKAFTSDYIAFSKGKNKVELLFELENGETYKSEVVLNLTQ